MHSRDRLRSGLVIHCYYIPAMETQITAADFQLYRDTGLHYQVNLRNSAFGFDAASDLTPGVNEGGLKVWECANDLIQYLRAHPELVIHKRVLELGCGQGLPGIACLLLGAAEVIFQDYTPDILNRVTLLNIHKNLGTTDKTRLISGPWTDYSSLSPVDLIISSETIYNPAYYPALLTSIRSCLTGTCLMASKTYYFGVGGGTELFMQAAQQTGFSTQLISHFQDGRSSLRDIISLRVCD